MQFKYITNMGNYSEVANRPPLHFNPNAHEVESLHLQRIKQTPFINSQMYSLSPPIFVEGVEMRLSHLLQPRFHTKQLFPLPELFKILESVLMALVEVESQGFTGYGDVWAEHLYYDTKSKQFKLIHPLMLGTTGIMLMRQRKRLSYLSPQQLLNLSQNISHSSEISLKSDVFSLGILMCEVCSLVSSNEIYCPETYSIFDLEIQNRYKIIDDLYGKEDFQGRSGRLLLRWVQDMLQYDQTIRKTPRQLLRDYSPACLDLLQKPTN